jgi:dihydrofolate reductase
VNSSFVSLKLSESLGSFLGRAYPFAERAVICVRLLHGETCIQTEEKGTLMGKVIFDISMSLDACITGANPRPVAGWGGLGEGGERLHDWGFNSADPRNRQIMEWYTTAGANIFGRTGYDHSILNWGADGPSGPARIPTVIVSHGVPRDIPAGGVYSFVDGIEAAFETARKLAGNKDVFIMGANVAQQFLQRGLIDEISIHLAPVLFGRGTRLFEGLESEYITLESIEVIQTAEAIHMRFRVVK